MAAENRVQFNPNPRDTLITSSWLYLLMAATGGTVAHSYHRHFFEVIHWGGQEGSAWQLTLIAILAMLILLSLSYSFEGFSEDYNQLKEILAQTMGPLAWPWGIYLAAISAIGEELLFRAALQPSLGLIFTSLIFGLLHLGPRGTVSLWTLWASLSGLLLGWIFENTNSILVVIVIHFAINSISLTRIRLHYLKENKPQSRKV